MRRMNFIRTCVLIKFNAGKKFTHELCIHVRLARLNSWLNKFLAIEAISVLVSNAMRRWSFLCSWKPNEISCQVVSNGMQFCLLYNVVYKQSQSLNKTLSVCIFTSFLHGNYSANPALHFTKTYSSYFMFTCLCHIH